MKGEFRSTYRTWNRTEEPVTSKDQVGYDIVPVSEDLPVAGMETSEVAAPTLVMLTRETARKLTSQRDGSGGCRRNQRGTHGSRRWMSV